MAKCVSQIWLSYLSSHIRGTFALLRVMAKRGTLSLAHMWGLFKCDMTWSIATSADPGCSVHFVLSGWKTVAGADFSVVKHRAHLCCCEPMRRSSHETSGSSGVKRFANKVLFGFQLKDMGFVLNRWLALGHMRSVKSHVSRELLHGIVCCACGRCRMRSPHIDFRCDSLMCSVSKGCIWLTIKHKCLGWNSETPRWMMDAWSHINVLCSVKYGWHIWKFTCHFICRKMLKELACQFKCSISSWYSRMFYFRKTQTNCTQRPCIVTSNFPTSPSNMDDLLFETSHVNGQFWRQRSTLALVWAISLLWNTCVWHIWIRFRMTHLNDTSEWHIWMTHLNG